MNIIAVRSNLEASGHYRITHPMEILRRRGHQAMVIQAEPDAAWTPAWFAGADVCILQMMHDPTFLDMIDLIPADQRPAVVYEVDDIIWQMGRERDTHHEFKAYRQGIMQAMHRCDAVICSTPELADHARQLNPEVFVWPNGIDFGIRDWRNPAPARCPNHSLIIGWAGGVRPNKDLAVMGTALRDVLHEHPEAAFAIAGEEEMVAGFAAELQIPAEQLYLLPLATFDTYPQLISLFDIGIAPIDDTLFNRCKSELKLLEYGAWGIPFVASDVAPYRRFQAHTEGRGGYLAGTPREWYNALKLLVIDGELRAMQGATLRGFVRRDRDLEGWMALWEAYLMSVAPRITPRELAIR